MLTKLTNLTMLSAALALMACSNDKVSGTTTTAENGIHGVARQSDGQYASENSEVKLKQSQEKEGKPAYQEVASARVGVNGEFYIAPPDTGLYVVEVGEAQDNQKFLKRKLIQITNLNKAYTLDTLVLKEVIEKKYTIQFDGKEEYFDGGYAYVGQYGSDELIKVFDGVEITISDFDPDLTELVIYYKKEQSTEYEVEYLWGLEENKDEIYVADFFIDDYEPVVEDLQECEIECEWDQDLEFETCLELGSTQEECLEQIEG